MFPASLHDFIVVFSNPIIMAVAFSMLIEKLPFIVDPEFNDLLKIAFTLLVGTIWGIVVTLLNAGLPVTADGWYQLIVFILGMTMSMNIWNKLVDTAIPWLKDFLLALFGKIDPVTSGKLYPGETSTLPESIIPKPVEYPVWVAPTANINSVEYSDTDKG